MRRNTQHAHTCAHARAHTDTQIEIEKHAEVSLTPLDISCRTQHRVSWRWVSRAERIKVILCIICSFETLGSEFLKTGRKENWICHFYLLKTRNNFESTRQEVERLMQRMKSANQDYRPPSQWTMEGYLYVQEKRESQKHNLMSLWLTFCFHETRLG